LSGLARHIREQRRDIIAKLEHRDGFDTVPRMR